MTKRLTSSAFKAHIFKMEKAGTPVTVTAQEIQAVKDYEEEHGQIEIACLIDDRNFTLKIARSWPDENRIDAISQNGNNGEHYEELSAGV